MSLPNISLINFTNTLYKTPDSGSLIYAYAPFRNLKNRDIIEGDTDLFDLRLSATSAQINIDDTGTYLDQPISITTEVSYDDSINLIINDGLNPAKIVNSRFYLKNSLEYGIADRKGNLDTNIYSAKDFPIEAGLIKTVRSITTLQFVGIYNGGNMPVGSYHFYFKLADADGNESDFVSESGKVVCHIGAVNQPSSIRGGQQDENSNKIIKFRLDNLDLGYDYINIYYTRHSGDEDKEYLKTYRITDKFKINGTLTEISITGYEEHVEIDSSEINIRYTNFDSIKTIENCQNITFTGNIVKNYEIFKKLEKYSLFITPELSYDLSIGNMDYNYIEKYPSEGYEYYNVNNIYYKLGYWEDIYRFGVVYILNDFTLSPVFSIRGIKELSRDTEFYTYESQDDLNYGEDFLLEKYIDKNNLENAKGVFTIKDVYHSDSGNLTVFKGEESIKPIGIKFNFTNVVDVNDYTGEGLRTLTKGFFIVRQKRIPNLLTQALAIATAANTNTPLINGTFYNSGNQTTSLRYFTESFLTKVGNKPRLGKDFPEVADRVQNALLCPDASLRTSIYNNYFNSSEFVLKTTLYGTSSRSFTDESGYKSTVFSLGRLKPVGDYRTVTTNLLLIEPGIELINNGDIKFSSRAGSPIETWKHLDIELGDVNNIVTDGGESNDNSTNWSNNICKIRGDFNTYLGSSKNLIFGQHYNIYQKQYNPAKWKDYFKLRYNDSSSFSPVSDRIEWSKLTNNSIGNTSIYTTNTQYRGDCYINTYAHRMIWNFIDPDLPTNTKILDPWTWHRNFKVKVMKVLNPLDSLDTSTNLKKVLPLFTYKDTELAYEFSGDTDPSSISSATVLEPDSKRFKKYSEANGLFGSTKINRPDVNAVALGHWASFKICSNTNTAMRDVDFSRPEEEAIHKVKRSFYPLEEAKATNKLPESNIINSGISNSLGDKYYFEIPDVPFIKTSFTNRIHYSEVLRDNTFKNGNRIFKAQNYQDYTLEHGELIKLIEWYGRLIAVMEHGILMIPVNERAMMTNAQGENVYINTENVLPKNPKVISNTYGSVWIDGIIKTSRFVYGIDTIAKKIWRTDGEKFEIISDVKIQKFLNDNINLKNIDRKRITGEYSIKTHYNAFKQDILFVFKYGDVKWHLCWNELTSKWVTRYSWFPDFSENINNIFYTFANKDLYNDKKSLLYKHGFAGSEEELGIIKPTYWYDTQEKFEFEVIVVGVQGVQKIFDNLKLISNLVPPESFTYEIVGEGYDWNKHKQTILNLNSQAIDLNDLKDIYESYLIDTPLIKKIPFIYSDDFDDPANINKDLKIRQHNKTKENLISSYQKGLDIKDKNYRRLKGNMEYVEDSWDVQIQPISFKYAYLKNNVLTFSNNSDMRIRDKYLRIRITYDGTQYAIINALRTFFTISYA